MNLVWAPQGHRRGTGLHVMPLCCSIARHALTEAIIGSIESPDADLGKWPAGKRTNGRTPPFRAQEQPSGTTLPLCCQR
jgi:hypothetical protein